MKSLLASLLLTATPSAAPIPIPPQHMDMIYDKRINTEFMICAFPEPGHLVCFFGDEATKQPGFPLKKKAPAPEQVPTPKPSVDI